MLPYEIDDSHLANILSFLDSFNSFFRQKAIVKVLLKMSQQFMGSSHV